MSVLIRGMEMPTSCDDCILNNGITCYAVPDYKEDGVVGRTDDRPDWCPLVPVPPHGRCVDADELTALVYANIALFDSAPGRMSAEQKLVRAWLASMVDDIKDAPTILEAEEGET